jgi:hypothetical protein
MDYDHDDLRSYQRARRLKFSLLDRMEADASIEPEQVSSLLSQNALRHFHLSKLVGVHVYQVTGGWVEDLVFSDMPLGTPRIWGTRHDMPYESREAAVEAALRSMTAVKQSSLSSGLSIEGDDDVVFELDSVCFTLSRRRIQETLDGYTGGTLASHDEMRARLDGFCEDMTGGDRPLEMEDVEALHPDDRTLLRLNIYEALIIGINTHDTPANRTASAPPMLM